MRRAKIFESRYVDGRWTKVEIGEGFFHRWGLDASQDEGGTYSVAIIETGDGKVKMPRADHIEFIDKIDDQPSDG